MSLRNSDVTSNTASGNGGGIYNDGDSGSVTVTLDRFALVNKNTATEGGGIYNTNDTGFATVNLPNTSASVTRNTATVGGGIFNLGTLSGHYHTDVYDNTGGNIDS